MTKPIKSLRFAGLSPEEIATQIEHDMRSAARKWRRAHPAGRAIGAAATRSAALYLKKYSELYMREDTAETKATHSGWMMLMQAWFTSTLDHKGSEDKP